MKVRKVALLQALGRQFDEYTKDQLTAFIVCRNVLVDGVLATDPRLLVDPNACFSFTFDAYVSAAATSWSMLWTHLDSMYKIW